MSAVSFVFVDQGGGVAAHGFRRDTYVSGREVWQRRKHGRALQCAPRCCSCWAPDRSFEKETAKLQGEP